MASHAAFLRGVNLGRMRKVSSAKLVEIFEGMRLDDVATFRTSGNVVFATGRRPREELTSRIERALAKALGFEVTTFVRTASELRAVASHSPFSPPEIEASKGKLQVSLLPGSPGRRARREILEMASDEDRLAFGPRELYWLPGGGTQGSALNRNAIEKLIGPTTTRTKDTIELLAAKYFG
jgi:uncharacterized protein (DUF1697 family)